MEALFGTSVTLYISNILEYLKYDVYFKFILDDGFNKVAGVITLEQIIHILDLFFKYNKQIVPAIGIHQYNGYVQARTKLIQYQNSIWKQNIAEKDVLEQEPAEIGEHETNLLQVVKHAVICAFKFVQKEPEHVFSKDVKQILSKAFETRHCFISRSRDDDDDVSEMSEAIHEESEIFTAQVRAEANGFRSDEVAAESIDGAWGDMMDKGNMADDIPYAFDKPITLLDIQGQWTYKQSYSDYKCVTVKGAEVCFWDNKKVYQIEESDDSFTLGGFVLKKSSRTFLWKHYDIFQQKYSDIGWHRRA